MKRDTCKVGQRWIWDRPDDNAYIVEVIDVTGPDYPKVKIIQKIRRMSSYELGFTYRESFTGDYWFYLEGQDKP